MFGGVNCNQNEQMVYICLHKVEIPSVSLKLRGPCVHFVSLEHQTLPPSAMQTSSEDTDMGSKDEFCLSEEEHYMDLKYLCREGDSVPKVF